MQCFSVSLNIFCFPQISQNSCFFSLRDHSVKEIRKLVLLWGRSWQGVSKLGNLVAQISKTLGKCLSERLYWPSCAQLFSSRRWLSCSLFTHMGQWKCLVQCPWGRARLISLPVKEPSWEIYCQSQGLFPCVSDFSAASPVVGIICPLVRSVWVWRPSHVLSGHSDGECWSCLNRVSIRGCLDQMGYRHACVLGSSLEDPV